VGLACALACSHASAAPDPAPVQGEVVVQQNAGQLDQLVAPIALYPDELVAQVLAACTYPTEIVEADRWMQEQSGLKGEDLARAVDQQSWDPSIKALTQFPSVLANLDKNLSWASALGDAYVNQQQAVLDAVQEMRRRAQQQGNLKSTPQQSVTSQDSTIVIQAADPEVVYVPTYDPWVVYGPPLVPYPGWYWYPGLYDPYPGITFGLGFGIGLYAGFGWGWHHWGADWRGHHILYDHGPYFSHSRTFFDRNHFYRGGPGFAGRPDFHGGGPGFHGPGGAGFHDPGGPGFHGPGGPGFHGPGGPGFHGPGGPGVHGGPGPGTHSGAFSGFDHGGVSRGFAGRGSFSAGGHAGGFAGHGGGHR
jgi:Protein of unknown function (DUF3300)